MALFQTSVLKSHLALLNETAVDKAYKKYQAYFWNTTIQDNIKTAKEEQYQATFLHELFVNILGYTLFPNPNSNLTTEFKNEKNARKADGAILKDGSAIGVIELKGTNTKDLESIRRQAFDYKANQKGCVYVITSNFEKLRFYINDATEFEEFDLFTLSRKRFDLLYLCLHLDKVLSHVPLKIKEASIAEEEQITKAFYKDYSLFKRELFRDLVKNNAKTVKAKLADASLDSADNDTDQADRNRLEKNVRLTLFKKSQKLIDRFLFIFFAEDRMLLPANSTLQILEDWDKLKNLDVHVPLYDRFKLYFKYLDQGRKGGDGKAEIYAYNGGLFKPDAILDAMEIDNDLLYKHTLQLSNYDFESQVDVNILGHIFENSLNEIESVNAEIEGGEFDKQTSKRKKDGVFYTPKYITKYIVENTLGKLCTEKKAALGFDEEQYFKGRKNRAKDTILNLVAILDEYREWLLQLTICDPACGSGAFLNQALDFLIKEHSYIDELKTKILGGGLQFSDIENTILENNIYGVDLNEESVEIAKLSLWLRTAQPRRKLNDLSSNIKCGNSLIDDKKVAGDKAFKWETAFAKVFSKGGFDVVIGNPPYGAEISKEDQKFYLSNFLTPSYKLDTYSVFIEKAFSLIKNDGFICYIVPYTWLTINQHQKLREFLLSYNLIEVINLPQKIFDDADLDTVIVNVQKSKPKSEMQFGHIEQNEIFIDGVLSLNRINKSKNKLINFSLSESDSFILLEFNQ
jgi:type I restriction-modification system DNA methylase subunit